MSQIRCGSLQEQDENAEYEFEGRVSIGKRLDGIIALLPHPMRGQSKKAPDWEVHYKHAGRQNFTPVGSGWNKVSDDTKTKFISMSLDNPDWAGELSLTAFEREFPEGGKGYDVIWSRPRGQRVQEQAAA